MKYKCKYSFKTTGGKDYRYGDNIDSYTYDRLEYSEKRNFEKEESGGFGGNTPGVGDMMGTGLPGGIDLDFTTPW
jgi:hypothetical protein